MKKFISILLLFSALGANAQSVKYFREVDFDQPEIKGIKPIEDSIVSHVNTYYKFTYNKDGQLSRVDLDHHFNHQFKHQFNIKFILIIRKDNIQTRIYYPWNGRKPDLFAIDSAKIIFNKKRTAAEYILYQEKNYSNINPHLYWTFNDKGLITKTIDNNPGGRSCVILTDYDENDRLVEKKEVYPANTSGDPKGTSIFLYKYDEKGNMIEFRCKNFYDEEWGVAKYKYDDRGYHLDDYPFGSEKYDSYGNICEKSIVPWGRFGGSSSSESWKYDNNGNLIINNQDFGNGKESISYQYDKNNGNSVVKVVSYHNGTILTRTQIWYDANENVVAKETYRKDTLNYKIERKYDSNQNLIEHINYGNSQFRSYRIVLDYFENKLHRISVYDENNKLMPLGQITPSKSNIKSEIAVVEFQYNQKEGKTTKTYYDDKMKEVKNEDENTLYKFYYYFSPNYNSSQNGSLF